MCIIIVKQQSNVVPLGTLKNCARINRHGLGIVWLDTFEVKKYKSKDYKLLHTNRPFIAHFRLATIGKVNKENVHPFVCGKKQNELLMMNGTIYNLGNHKECDTKVLARQLGNVPREMWRTKLSKIDCRFVSINTFTRTFQIYNKHLWTKRDGIWYSKDNVLQDELVAVYGTLKRGHHNHHLLASSTFVGRGVTAKKYPMISRGVPFVGDVEGIGYNINVEVYKVSEGTLSALDSLENHPNWYERRKTEVHAGGRVYTCWLYFNDTISYKNQKLIHDYENIYSLYDEDDGLEYMGDLDEQELEEIKRIDNENKIK
jgi:gamma-glutamylcyclotransferase (GGCT)/AIG2-like uncharacterized protein YtfP|tara:strand:+ start:48 stop:992 length:945 start_codon:yes stop_codon:yes gene_type:complete